MVKDNFKRKNWSVKRRNRTVKRRNRSVKRRNQLVKRRNQSVKRRNQSVKRRNQSVKRKKTRSKQFYHGGNLLYLLGLNYNAESSDIMKAYKKKILTAHTDKGGSGDLVSDLKNALNDFKENGELVKYERRVMEEEEAVESFHKRYGATYREGIRKNTAEAEAAAAAAKAEAEAAAAAAKAMENLQEMARGDPEPLNVIDNGMAQKYDTLEKAAVAAMKIPESVGLWMSNLGKYYILREGNVRKWAPGIPNGTVEKVWRITSEDHLKIQIEAKAMKNLKEMARGDEPLNVIDNGMAQEYDTLKTAAVAAMKIPESVGLWKRYRGKYYILREGEGHYLRLQEDRAEIDAMSVKQLRERITAHGMSYADCVEKSDLRERAWEAIQQQARGRVRKWAPGIPNRTVERVWRIISEDRLKRGRDIKRKKAQKAVKFPINCPQYWKDETECELRQCKYHWDGRYIKAVSKQDKANADMYHSERHNEWISVRKGAGTHIRDGECLPPEWVGSTVPGYGNTPDSFVTVTETEEERWGKPTPISPEEKAARRKLDEEIDTDREISNALKFDNSLKNEYLIMLMFNKQGISELLNTDEDYKDLQPDPLSENILDYPDIYGLTPLMWAVLLNSLDYVKLLISKGANINYMSNGPAKLVLDADKRGKKSEVQLQEADKALTVLNRSDLFKLFEIGSLIGLIERDIKEMYGLRALEIAIDKQYTEVIDYLISNGAYRDE